jgi:hypothetical protein
MGSAMVSCARGNTLQLDAVLLPGGAAGGKTIASIALDGIDEVVAVGGIVMEER